MSAAYSYNYVINCFADIQEVLASPLLCRNEQNYSSGIMKVYFHL